MQKIILINRLNKIRFVFLYKKDKILLKKTKQLNKIYKIDQMEQKYQNKLLCIFILF